METEQAYRVGEYYLTKNRNGYWCRTWYCEQTQQRKSNSLGTRDFSAAKQALDIWFVNNVTPVLEDDLELSRCLLEYWKQHAQYLKRRDTERRNAAYWLEFFKDELVKNIRAPKQREFIEHLRGKGFARGTIESVFKTGSAAINYAWRNDMMLHPLPIINAGQHLKKYKMAKVARWRHMELEEVALMFEHATTERLMRYLIVLIGCAGRPSAAIEISGSRIDLNAGTMDLLLEDGEQTNKYRATVRLPSFIKAIYCPDNIVSQSKHVPNVNNMRNRYWLPTRNAAGLDKLVVPSSLRHTMAKWLRSQGVEPWHVSAHLGHKRGGSEITEIYAPSDPAYLSDVLKATEKYFREVKKLSPRLRKYMKTGEFKQ